MNYLDTLNTLQEYYSNLLIIQYHGKPKAKATIKMLVNLIWVNMALLQIRDAFDWTTAIGTQLDLIGEWVGVDRFYVGNLYDYQPWFALIDWNSEGDNLQGGFSTFDTFNSIDGGILTYNYLQNSRNQLTDENFRIMIGLKIIKNSISATCKNIDNAIWNYFNGKVYTTWSPNKITYHYTSDLSEVIQVALGKNVLPAPTCVEIEIMEIIENG